MFCLETLNKAFSEAMIDIPKGDIGVGVSGGGDSMALLHLSAEWAEENKRKIKAVTIDHGLRSSSLSECVHVKKISEKLSIEHTTLKWLAKPSGNLQNAARNARHELFLDWTKKSKLSVVLLGHTMDDNAETIMIKLIRGSGIDGLAGISKNKKINELAIFRPLINITRDDLRKYLIMKNIQWIDEPSNFDERFERIKVRNLLPKLSDFGLTAKKLIALSSHMNRAKEALNGEVLRFAKQHVQQKNWGDLEIKLDEFIKIPKEYQFRLLSAALLWISGKVYRPRFNSLERLIIALNSSSLGRGSCLMGCLIKCDEEKIILSREFSAISKPSQAVKSKFLWEKHWQLVVDSSKINNTMIGPLGKKGLKQIENSKSFNVPRTALMCSVAMFDNEKVLCLPIISYGSGLKSNLIGGTESFQNYLLAY